MQKQIQRQMKIQIQRKKLTQIQTQIRYRYKQISCTLIKRGQALKRHLNRSYFASQTFLFSRIYKLEKCIHCCICLLYIKHKRLPIAINSTQSLSIRVKNLCLSFLLLSAITQLSTAINKHVNSTLLNLEFRHYNLESYT